MGHPREGFLLIRLGAEALTVHIRDVDLRLLVTGFRRQKPPLEGQLRIGVDALTGSIEAAEFVLGPDMPILGQRPPDRDRPLGVAVTRLDVAFRESNIDRMGRCGGEPAGKQGGEEQLQHLGVGSSSGCKRRVSRAAQGCLRG